MMLFISLLVIVVTTVSAGDCPEFCECRQYLRDLDPLEELYTTINCKANANFTQGLPDNTVTLIFKNTSIQFDNLLNVLCSVKDLPHFSQLILSGTSISSNLSNITISGLDQLRLLEISNCKVHQLPYFNLTKLQLLELSDNFLKVIDTEQFRTLPDLEVLNLSKNVIDSIKKGSFIGLTKLKKLDLSQNNLMELSDDVLLPLGTLQHLNLSMNKLVFLNETCFSSLLYLQQLDVSSNKLTHMAPGSLQLPSLAQFLLNGNPQLGSSLEPPLFFGTSRRLQTIDASRTGLKQVPASLTHSIRTLKLAGNLIITINCGDLDSYPLLQLLDLSSNDLLNIEEDALGRLDSLIVLYLTDNKLRRIPHSLPDKLRVLYLEYNDIRSIHTSDLQGLSQLEVLLLPHNKIKMVKEAAFSQLTSLSSLDLSYNPIITLPTGSLAGPLHLRILRMAGLNVVTPAKEVEFPLPTPEHLITLDLSNSPGLAHQMLADTAALAGAKELQELNLARSSLTYIRSDLLHFLPQLQVLHLYDNPLNCTDLQWLADWMIKQDKHKYRNVICASPSDLENTALVDLQSTYQIQNENEQTTENVIFTRRKENYYDTGISKSLLTSTQASTFPDDNKSTNKKSSTQPTNLNLEMTTKHLIQYPESELAKPPNILSENKSSYTKLNRVSEGMPSGTDSNLFMKFSLRKLDRNQKVDDNLLLKKTGTVIGESSFFLQTTSTEPKIWDRENGTAEMSMYSGESQQEFAHSGMLILAVAFVSAVAIFITCTINVKLRNKRSQAAMEVNRLPHVTELW